MTMREDLADWCDWDEAALSYGIAIGVFVGADRRQVSRVLLSANPLGDGLHAGMMALVAAGVVEHRVAEEEQFRWVFEGAADLPGIELAGLGTDLPQLAEVPPAVQAARARHWWQRG